MPRAGAAQLPEVAEIVQRDGRLARGLIPIIHLLDAGQVQHRIQQHRRMTARQHESVAAGPPGMLRIVPHHIIPQRVRDRCQGHGRPRMAAVRLLDAVHGQGADGVDRQGLDTVGGCCHACVAFRAESVHAGQRLRERQGPNPRIPLKPDNLLFWTSRRQCAATGWFGMICVLCVSRSG